MIKGLLTLRDPKTYLCDYYSLRRWMALTRFVDDGQLPVDTDVR